MREPGPEPGRSWAQKIRGFFAWVHGAGEVVRGKVNSCIAELAGEESTRDIEEERTRRGKREMINQEREREPSPLPTRTRNM